MLCINALGIVPEVLTSVVKINVISDKLFLHAIAMALEKNVPPENVSRTCFDQLLSEKNYVHCSSPTRRTPSHNIQPVNVTQMLMYGVNVQRN